MDRKSITLVGSEKAPYTDGVDRWRREYRGLEADFALLPVEDDLSTGSFCIFLDTGNYAEYLAYNKTWYLFQ